MTLDIVMPFYGRVDHFRAAVESVRKQTDTDWRLVVIDDHYPDRSAGQWLVELGDPRIEYRRNDVNLGINANFQASIEAADNSWLTIFGCDDVMLPNYVSRIRELTLTSDEVDFIHPGVRIIDDAGRPSATIVDAAKAVYRPKFRGSTTLSGEALAVSLTRGNWMNFPAIAWRTDVVKSIGFRTNLNVAQDLALALDIARQGEGTRVGYEL